MEYWGKKTYQTCVDPALEVLEQIDLPEYPPHLKNPIQTMYLDLRFFKMFFWGLAYQEDSSENYRHLRRPVRTMMLGFRKKAKKFEVQFECAADAEKITNWESMSYHVRKGIEHYKQRAKEVCIRFLDGAFKCKPCQNKNLFLDYAKETASFLDLIQENLRLLDSFIDMTPLVKQQIAFLQGKLKVFGKFVSILTYTSTGAKQLGELISHTQTWANHFSCFACLYWIDDKMDESLASTMGSMLSDLMQKHIPCTPEVIALYLDVLIMAPRSDDVQSEVSPQLIVSYIDFLLEHLVIPTTKDDIAILREGLIFLLSFFIDQKEEDSNGNKLILKNIYAIISELPSVICIPETNFDGFLNKMERVKVEVADMYNFTPLSQQFNSSRTNATGFLDSLLEKLKKMLEGKVHFIPSVEEQIKIVQEELESVKPFLPVILELENGHEELKDLCIQIVNVVHLAAYVTDLCLTPSFSLWYGIICLPNVIEDIKLVKSKVRKIEDDQKYGNRISSDEMKSNNNALPTQATTSKNEGAFIGFKEDVRSILDHLVRGRKALTILSISGMPGQGKTTLAKRIYNDPSVQYHFQKLVWCYVSKEPKTKELLAGIVRDVANVVDVNLETQDLCERLRKSLKGKRYLIVLDDIWDVEVWRQVQMSFPDDSNGSRILFTSRNHELASQAKPNSISHPHRLFSDEESWELMKGKIFNEDGFPPQFLEIGRQIAVHCKGMPLAVALIASHLKRTRQISEWMQVERDLNMKSHPAMEGCMHVIELSYKYLADHLKPCFLYFGAFPRGDIRAKKLKQLWIAEGFMKENELKCSEDLAKEYLDDLVSLSLVVVTERSSTGGIKRCNLHDLLYDLFLRKVVEDNFFYSLDDFHHRVWVNVDGFGVSMSPKLTCTRKELPVSQTRSLLSVKRTYSGEVSYESFRFLCSRLKVVTVLDLGNVVIRLPKFPKVLLYNIHLRFLSLRGDIKNIPPSIVNLRNLETLIVESYPVGVVESPHSLWEMKSLRHVDIDVFHLHLEEGFEGLYESIVETESCNIETLCGIILSHSNKTEEFLRKRLSRLRKLRCYVKNRFNPKCLSVFGSLKKLESLEINGFLPESFESPKQFPLSVFGSLKKLESLEINGFLPGSFESPKQLPEINFPDNVKKLTLTFLQIPWAALSTIGKLPNLEVLKLRYEACEGTTWDLGDGEFSELRYLQLYEIDVEKINDSGCDDHPFPRLEKLLLIDCERLEDIPSSFGDICTLDTIDVSNSLWVSDSVKRILERRQDTGNDNHHLQVLGLCNT